MRPAAHPTTPTFPLRETKRALALPSGQPADPTAATPIAFVAALVQAYARYRMDPSEALRRAQIAPALLRRPEARVTAMQFETLCNAAMQQLDDEALGWFSRKLPWGSYGMLCRASITSPTLGVALKRWCRHHRLLTDDIVLQMQVERDIATVSIREQRDLGTLREFCLMTNLRYVLGYACWLIDSRIALHEARFPFVAPSHAAVYPLLFRGPVQFETPCAALVFPAQYLAQPLRRDEQALQLMLKRALPLTVLAYRRDRLLVQRVRALLRARPDKMSNADAIAGALHLSRRTLYRQLRAEGASLQALKDDARREQAIELLRRTRRSIKQIAAAVGFDNAKSFARAFRAWTGTAPIEYRRSSTAGG